MVDAVIELAADIMAGAEVDFMSDAGVDVAARVIMASKDEQFKNVVLDLGQVVEDDIAGND